MKNMSVEEPPVSNKQTQTDLLRFLRGGFSNGFITGKARNVVENVPIILLI